MHGHLKAASNTLPVTFFWGEPLPFRLPLGDLPQGHQLLGGSCLPRKLLVERTGGSSIPGREEVSRKRRGRQGQGRRERGEKGGTEEGEGRERGRRRERQGREKGETEEGKGRERGRRREGQRREKGGTGEGEGRQREERREGWRGSMIAATVRSHTAPSSSEECCPS